MDKTSILGKSWKNQWTVKTDQYKFETIYFNERMELMSILQDKGIE